MRPSRSQLERSLQGNKGVKQNSVRMGLKHLEKRMSRDNHSSRMELNTIYEKEDKEKALQQNGVKDFRKKGLNQEQAVLSSRMGLKTEGIKFFLKPAKPFFNSPHLVSHFFLSSLQT